MSYVYTVWNNRILRYSTNRNTWCIFSWETKKWARQGQKGRFDHILQENVLIFNDIHECIVFVLANYQGQFLRNVLRDLV